MIKEYIHNNLRIKIYFCYSGYDFIFCVQGKRKLFNFPVPIWITRYKEYIRLYVLHTMEYIILPIEQHKNFVIIKAPEKHFIENINEYKKDLIENYKFFRMNYKPKDYLKFNQQERTQEFII